MSKQDNFGDPSTPNTSTTALGSGETFTGGWEVSDFPDVMVSCKTDNTGTLYFDFSNDQSNADTFPSNGFKVAAGAHEFQHAIQDTEGFARGGTHGMFNEEILKKLRVDQIQKEKDAAVWRLTADQMKKYQERNRAHIKALDSQKDEDWDSLYKLENELMETPEGARVLDLDFDLMNADAGYDNKILSPNDAYRRLAGEAEARNVQTRMDYPISQRIEQPPWTTLDVPEDELIYRFK